jgi:hypothetical protein
MPPVTTKELHRSQIATRHVTEVIRWTPVRNEAQISAKLPMIER